MRDVIVAWMAQLEREYDIRIIYACENGSRNWGMESPDSDWDVRFVFKRSPYHYLTSLSTKNQVIIRKEESGAAVLECQGWDIYKVRTMMAKSNPVLIEWMTSDIIYKDIGGAFLRQLYETATTRYNPLALAYHYRSMGKNNYYKYIDRGNDVCYKRYLYAFRGLFNAMWVVFNKSLPPAHFEDAVKLSDFLPAKIKVTAQFLIDNKRKMFDKTPISRIDFFDKYLHEQFELFEIPHDINHRVEFTRDFDKAIVGEVLRE